MEGRNIRNAVLTSASVSSNHEQSAFSPVVGLLSEKKFVSTLLVWLSLKSSGVVGTGAMTRWAPLLLARVVRGRCPRCVSIIGMIVRCRFISGKSWEACGCDGCNDPLGVIYFRSLWHRRFGHDVPLGESQVCLLLLLKEST